MNTPRPTPETDVVVANDTGDNGFLDEIVKTCRRLERERDETVKQLEAMRDELQKVCQQRDAWAMRCDKLDVTAMREAIKEAIDSLNKCSRVIGAPKTYEWADEDVCDAAYNSAQTTLAKLKPFLP